MHVPVAHWQVPPLHWQVSAGSGTISQVVNAGSAAQTSPLQPLEMQSDWLLHELSEPVPS